MIDAGDVRDQVVQDGFGDVSLGSTVYHGINRMIPLGWHTTIGDALGDRFVKPVLSFFCLSGEDHKLESGAYIHVDHVFSPHVAIVYLSDPETIPSGSGTAFWRHKKYGWETMPNAGELMAVGLTIQGFIEHWKDPDLWDQIDLIEEKWNRLAIFEANRFHSRWPMKGRGTTPENSRLIWTSWFNCI